MRPFRTISGTALVVALLAWTVVAPAHPIVGAFERFYAEKADTAAVEGGLLLLNELNCVACHTPPPAWRDRLPGRGRISLVGVGTRLSSAALLDLVHDPARVKPGSVMPQITAGDRKDDPVIVAYLQSLTAPQAKAQFPVGDAERGRRLFDSVGCAACHAPSGGAGSHPSVPLGLAAHYDRNALAAFLKDPLHTRPAGRMPATALSDREASDLAEFLGARSLPAAPAIAPAERGIGRTQFAARNCMACHETGETWERPSVTPLAALRAEAGCLLATPPAGAPRYRLSPAQTRAVTAALTFIRATPTPESLTAADRVRVKFEQLNCYACHAWRGRGGPDEARARHFVATDSAAETLGELGRIPPSLDTAGRKLTDAWLEKLLWGTGGGVRPYMSVRMPRFGREAAAEIPAALAEACRPDRPLAIDTSGGLGHQRAPTGRALMGTGNGGLGCVNCHGLKKQEPHGIHAINLTHTAERLRPEYFKALLLDPQRLQPGTIMPPLFTGRVAADKEVESVWTYLKELDQSPMLPEGLAVAGTFELKPEVEGRPIVFRTFLEGAGTQAIAVGHPSGVHAAFDAFEVRWALVWRGRFVDAQQNWEERAMKPVKALGEKVVTLANRMPFARMEAATAAWPTAFGTRAGYVFKGYRLGSDGVPTFRYTVGGLDVEDTLRPAADGAAFRRRVVVRGSESGWYFRGLAPPVEAQPVVWKNGEAVWEETISL